MRHHSPREREVHETEHRAREQRDGVRLVEEIDGDVLHLLLVYHAKMHPIVHIVLTESLRSVRGRHGRPLMLAALLHQPHAFTRSRSVGLKRVDVASKYERTAYADAREKRRRYGIERWQTLGVKTHNSCVSIGEARAGAMESRVGQTRKCSFSPQALERNVIVRQSNILLFTHRRTKMVRLFFLKM